MGIISFLGIISLLHSIQGLLFVFFNQLTWFSRLQLHLSLQIRELFTQKQQWKVWITQSRNFKDNTWMYMYVCTSFCSPLEWESWVASDSCSLLFSSFSWSNSEHLDVSSVCQKSYSISTCIVLKFECTSFLVRVSSLVFRSAISVSLSCFELFRLSMHSLN